MAEKSQQSASTKSEQQATKSDNTTDPKLLAKQCHALIGAIAKKSAAVKLLTKARDDLRDLASYKRKV